MYFLIMTKLSKLPLKNIRELVLKYPATVIEATGELTPKDSLETHLKIGLQSLWSGAAKGDWKKFDKVVEEEVDMLCEENNKWMKAAE